MHSTSNDPTVQGRPAPPSLESTGTHRDLIDSAVYTFYACSSCLLPRLWCPCNSTGGVA